MIKTDFRKEIAEFANKKSKGIEYSNLSDSRFVYHNAWRKLARLAIESVGNPHDEIVQYLYDHYENKANGHSISYSYENRVKVDVFHDFMKEFSPSYPDPGLNLLIEQISGENCLPELKGFTGDNTKLVIQFCMIYLNSEKEDLYNNRLSTSYADHAETRSSETKANDSNANRLSLLEKQIKHTQMAYVKAISQMDRIMAKTESYSSSLSPK